MLISLREFGDDKADLIHKYYPEEAYELQELTEIPAHIAINEGMPDEEGMEENDLIVGEGEGSDEEGEEKKNDDLDIDDI